MNMNWIKSEEKNETNNRTVLRKILYWMGFVLLLGIYLAIAQLTAIVAQSQEIFPIGNLRMPLSAYTGVVSAVSNICFIAMVIFYGKKGYITTLIVFAVRMVRMLYGVIILRNLPSIPGIATSIVLILSVTLIFNRNIKIEKMKNKEIENLKGQQRNQKRLFEQISTALVTAVDAKDEYTNGHSLRVAEYSEKLARELGKTEDECYQIYNVALLHDVGKIGIDDNIIRKKGRLTEEEYNAIKEHPIKGERILMSVNEYPFLTLGAKYHHERYDGKGYPEGLKGEDIPEIARIIAVADAYDAMTSNRSYRDAMPQQLVREEIVKNSGTQFDPVIAEKMLNLIDLDVEYDMKEKHFTGAVIGKNEISCEKIMDEVMDGILITPCMTKITFKASAVEEKEKCLPTVILYDSLDAHIHAEKDLAEKLLYTEYCIIRSDGQTEKKEARSLQYSLAAIQNNANVSSDTSSFTQYTIEAAKRKDHVRIKISDGKHCQDVTVALPDSSRYAYIGLSGENCRLFDSTIEQEEKPVADGFISRIAEEISYIKGCPEGNIKNVQIDGHKTASTIGIPVSNKVSLSFHATSLPTARLVWHCPYIVIFSSSDKKVYGKDYVEHALIRLDGEKNESDSVDECRLSVEKREDFGGWDAWKKAFKQGIDSVVTIRKTGNSITLVTENLGIGVKADITVTDPENDIYVALTGDQVALTNINTNFE